MSFNPNFPPRGDEPDFDGELPADFAALAEQLGEQLQADAQRLSSVYPACQPPTKLIEALASQSQPQWSRRKVFAVVSSAAAAILLVAGLITVAISPDVLRIARDEPAAVPNNDLVHVPPTLPDHADLQPVSFRPSVMDVNGPELEGLLDLWQEQPPAAGRISF